jgi:DNA-directed RNA polymerase subunit M/transcription elongation factor TFIIS
MSNAEEQLEQEITGEKPRVVPNQSKGLSLLAEPAPIPLILPSKGILYKNDPKVGEVDKDGQIFIRPITLDDLELFVNPELIETGTVIDALFNRIIKSKINPKYLLVSDRNYILLYARAQSYGPEYSFSFKCKACDKSIKKMIDLGDLTVRYLDEIHGQVNERGDLIPDSVKKIKEPFVANLSMSGAKVTFNLARGIDESEANTNKYRNRVKKEVEKKKQVLSNVPDETTVTMEEQPDSLIDVLSRNIIKIESADSSETFTDEKDIRLVLSKLKAGDISELQEQMRSADSGVDMNTEVVCPSCKHRNEVSVPLNENFFRREVRQRSTQK